MTMSKEQPSNQQILDVLKDIQKRVRGGAAVIDLENADDNLYAGLLRVAQIEHILSEPNFAPEGIIEQCRLLRDNLKEARAKISDYENSA